jgi:hypothetical protein
VKDQVLGVTYFRYAVPFDAAAEEAGTWHWPEAVPPTADVGLLVPPAVPVVAGGDAPVVVYPRPPRCMYGQQRGHALLPRVGVRYT